MKFKIKHSIKILAVFSSICDKSQQCTLKYVFYIKMYR